MRMQDLIDSQVFLQQDGSPVGTVIDVFDGTGMITLVRHAQYNINLPAAHAPRSQCDVVLPMLTTATFICAQRCCLAGPGAHDLLQISLSADQTAAQSQSQQQRTMLLPFVKEFVPSIDEENGTIHISPPLGLLELALTPPSKSKKTGRSKAKL